MASEMSIVRSIMDSGIYHVPSSFFLRFAQKTRIGDKRDRVTRSGGIIYGKNSDRSESIQAGTILHCVRRNRLWHGPDSLRGSGVSICFNPASLRAGPNRHAAGDPWLWLISISLQVEAISLQPKPISK